MSFIVDSVISEGLVSLQSLQVGTLVSTVASATLQLLVGSVTSHVFQGTVAGQIVKMPNATTLSAIGYKYKLINDSTQNITVQDFDSVDLFILAPKQRAELLCISVSTTAGVWSYDITEKSTSGGGDFDTVYPGTGLTVNYRGGVYRFDGALTVVAGGSIALPGATTGTMYVDTDGVVKATASLPDGAMPLYEFITTTVVTSLTDVREQYENNDVYGVDVDISDISSANVQDAGVLNKAARADHVHASTLPLFKSGSVAQGSFTSVGQGPKTAAVLFTTALPDTSYTVTITGVDGRSWIVTNIATTGFTINSQANTALTGAVSWQVMAIGESV